MQVYRATRLETSEVCALKVVFWGNPEVKDHHKKILRKEVQVLRELHHDNIVRIIEHSETAEQLVLVLEYLGGGGLLEHLTEVEHYSEAAAAALFKQMLQAVCFMHSRNVIHRDIKPENMVFVTPAHGLKRGEQPHVKLVDFGLARHYSSVRSVKARLGSPGFMSPEVRLPSDGFVVTSCRRWKSVALRRAMLMLRVARSPEVTTRKCARLSDGHVLRRRWTTSAIRRQWTCTRWVCCFSCCSQATSQ